jgi:hydrogenase-4 component F
MINPVALILLIPVCAAALLALLPGYRLTSQLSVLASLLTLLAALSLFVVEPGVPGSYLLVDDFNIVFVVLNTFVAFTTSVFSASYIGHELEIGKLTPLYLRFYHAMYQVLIFAMNLALVANNIGLMWVAIELATLTTVLMVGIYRTHEALEAAWKYFILGSVGIALALFGTILVYLAAQPVVGEGLNASRSSIPRCSMSRSCSCCWGTGPRSGSRRCMPGCPMRMPKVRHRFLRCFPVCCSMSRSMPCYVSRYCSPATPARSRRAHC